MQNKILKYCVVFIIFFNTSIDIKSAITKEQYTQPWFNIIPLAEILENNSQVTYQKLVDKIYFDYPKFSIAPDFPNKGYFEDLFVLFIPQGKVQGICGYVFINEKLPDEFVRANRYDCLQWIQKKSGENVFKIPGKVAVISQHGAARYFGLSANYYHTLCEVFARLALLEMHNIEYDRLYVPTTEKFMLEALELWGIDVSKVVSPVDDDFCLQAEELIVPSLVINTSVGHKHSGNFQHPTTLKYMREKLLVGAQKKGVDISKFSKRVFITRKDALNNPRHIVNEDEIFEMFEKKGFKRYSLCNLSVAEQIMLFHNAEIVVSEQGSGLTNILFCQPNTKVIEIFQHLVDNCFWWVSNVFQLQYIPITTIQIDFNSFANWWDKGPGFIGSCHKSAYVPLDEIKKCVEGI